MRRLEFLVALLLATPATAGELFVTTTTYEITGSCSTMALDSPYSTVNDRFVIHSDAVARAHGGTLFVVNRYLQDNILTLDADDWSVVTQFSLGNGSNPQDIEVVGPARAYVSRYESAALWIVDPWTGTKLGEIDLGPVADADGIPEMGDMRRVGHHVFVSLQHLDRNNGFTPVGTSQLAVIDTRTDTLVDTDPAPGVQGVALPWSNPFWQIRVDPISGDLLVACSGGFLVADGGLARVDPGSFVASATPLTEAALGGDLLTAVVVSGTVGWALRQDASFQTCLLRFHPGTGVVDPPLYCTPGFDLADLEVAQGRLYLADRTSADPGVRIYDAVTGTPLAGPVDTGLPPFDLEPVGAAPVAADLAPTRPARLVAWPNPSASTTHLRLVDARARKDRLAPRVVVHDLRGRRITTLDATAGDAAGWDFRWNGRDDTGQAVAAGVYVASAGATRVRLLRLR